MDTSKTKQVLGNKCRCGGVITPLTRKGEVGIYFDDVIVACVCNVCQIMYFDPRIYAGVSQLLKPQYFAVDIVWPDHALSSCPKCGGGVVNTTGPGSYVATQYDVAYCEHCLAVVWAKEIEEEDDEAYSDKF